MAILWFIALLVGLLVAWNYLLRAALVADSKQRNRAHKLVEEIEHWIKGPHT